MLHNNDIEFLSIIGEIENNTKFNKLKYVEHHGTTRYDHSYRVAFISYKIAKTLNLNYIETARAGLLHDFFWSEADRNLKQKLESTVKHPKIVVENVISEFQISGKELDIIRTHMFPLNLSLPRYPESWIVSTVDKIVGIYEFSKKYEKKLKYATSIFILFLLGHIK